MAKRTRGAEIRAGIVVLIGLGILAGGLFWVSGGKEQFTDKAYYTIHFDNGGGIGSGDGVYLAGQRAGEVKSVKIVEVEEDGEVRPSVAVRIEIGAEDKIYTDCRFVVSKTITGIVSLNIDYGEESKQPADEKSPLRGERFATFEEAINRAEVVLGQAQEGVELFTEMMMDMRDKIRGFDLEKMESRIDSILANADRASGNLAELTATVKEDWSRDLKPSVQRTLDNTGDLTASLKTDWSESLKPRAEKTLDNFAESSSEMTAIIKENRERVKSILQSLDDAARRVGPALANIESLGKNLNETVIEARPKLVQTIENARTAMGNFESLTEDLKTAPWKLINKPSEDESDDVHLYNASRLYVEAAARIGDNIQDLETLRRLGVLDDPGKKDLADKVIRILEQSLAEFETRQQRLVAAMAARRK